MKGRVQIKSASPDWPLNQLSVSLLASASMRTIRADALLMLGAIICGVGFVVHRTANESVGPITFSGARFLLGAILLVPLLRYGTRLSTSPRLPASRSSLMLGMLGAGLAMTIGGVLQQIGLVYTSAGIAGFITGLYVIFVPLIGLLIGYFVRWSTWLAVVVAMLGLYLLTVEGQPSLNIGDLYILFATVAWAAQVLIIGWLALRADPIRIAIVQNSMAAVILTILAFILEEPDLHALSSIWPELLYSGGLAVGLAFLLQIIAQQHAPPAHAAVLLAMEAVFAALAGWAFLSETLHPIQLIGCILMFIGIVLAQLRPPRPMIG